ncbi:lymphocyte antigen 6D-like [Cololabis saira]|uniref:lymphocyte antigen 6D-like n=1 Tax=Cololabis saira TaxID=129043 RepID=UPI002AD46D61|nr:lymphocyte antigen 6D-like [Cololabis saira]
MKLIFSLTFILALSITAEALQCYVCTNQECSSTAPKTCGSETMCITASIRATSFGTSGTQIYKDCALSSFCPTTGNQTFSVNLGVSSALASAQCCDTDDCNSQTLLFPAPELPNGLRCYVCDPTTSQCTSSIPCSGEESSCFQATEYYSIS